MARPNGFEPLTPALEGRCSIQLSYERSEWFVVSVLGVLERVMGIGPTQPAWKAGTLPLSYTRTHIPNYYITFEKSSSNKKSTKNENYFIL